MFKVPDHQVAGHKAGKGKLGPLIDDSGRFYKPLQGDERGAKELSFYTSFSSNTRIPDHIRSFFPVFYGTKLVEASDGSGVSPHIVLQDVVLKHINPSIMDLKMGARTWYPQASADYIDRCFQKDRATTSSLLGFRVSGLQIYENKESGFWKPLKQIVMAFKTEDVRLVLRKFVSSNSPTNSNSVPNCSFAPIVYGGSAGILAQLLELKAWFEHQTIYNFNSCSILMVYEKESLLQGRNSGAEIKLVDFAHVVEGTGVIDHNFLGGLCSLINFIREILTGLDDHSNTACLLDTEKKCIIDNVASE